MLVLAMIGSVVIFTFLMLAYGLRTQMTHWYDFPLPRVFWFSTAAILVSSFTLHQAKYAAKVEEFGWYRHLLAATIVLGFFFAALQAAGWLEMKQNGFLLSSEISSAFVYVITGLHVIHLAVGIVALSVMYINALKNSKYVDAFVNQLNPKRQEQLKMISIYWHFIDLLWLILFMFMLYFHR